MDLRFFILLLCTLVHTGNCFECDPIETVCETSLVIDARQTMTHIEHSAVWAKNGLIYKADDTNATSPIDYSDGDVITADGSDLYRRVVVANGTLPGPEFIVYEGQLLRINVINKLKSETTTIHWHGLPQHDSPWMDGVGGVTQCPINPNSEFMYQFYARPKGTYWYHAHVGSQRANGLFGALVIREKTQATAREHIMTINGWNHLWDADMDFLKMGSKIYIDRKLQPQTESIDQGEFEVFRLTSALINGRGRVYDASGKPNGAPLSVFDVDPNQEYRFRIIGAGAMYPFQVSIDSHKMTLIASDGYDIKPIVTDAVIINPGERYDVLIHTNATSKKSYWIRAQTLEVEVDHKVEAILRYTGAAPEDPTSSSQKRSCTANDRCRVINCPFSYFPESFYTDCIRVDHLRSAMNNDPAPNEKGDNFEEYFLNYAAPGIKARPPSINGIAFQVPSVSALTQPIEIDTLCDAKSGCGEDKLCKCTHSLSIKPNKTIQIVFTNMGMGSDDNHPVHMHGYSFYVVKMGYGQYNETTAVYLKPNDDINCRGHGTKKESFCNSPTWSNSSWLGGNVPDMELANAPRKDTVIIPVGGYAVVRLHSDNPGVWLMHCHIDLHANGGMMMVLNVSYGHQPAAPPNFPTCGSYRHPYPTAQPPPPTPITPPRNEPDTQKETDGEEFTSQMFYAIVGLLAGIILLLFIVIVLQCRTKPSGKQTKYDTHMDKDNPAYK